MKTLGEFGRETSPKLLIPIYSKAYPCINQYLCWRNITLRLVEILTIRAYFLKAMVKTLVKFSNPPVVEVVCGQQFATIREWRSHHYGLFWQTLEGDLPVVEDKPPLPTGFELPLGPASPPKFEYMDSFLPRVWFHSQDRRKMVQVQNDRLLFNWRKSGEDHNYPSFEVVKREFDKYSSKFSDFLKSAGFAPLNTNQYEVTYVNHIGPKNGFAQFGNDELFADHKRHTAKDRLLGPTESINLRWTYAMPKGWGRLTAHAQTAFLPDVNNEKIIRFDVTARGWPGPGTKEREEWFLMAHEWITRGFTEMTSPDAHKLWQRTK